MKRKMSVFGLLLFSCVVSRALYAADYWTGDGGRGKSLAVFAPEGNGFSDESIMVMVQGQFQTTMKRYSAMVVEDRLNWEANMKELELRNDSDIQDIGELAKADHLLRGTITKTSSGFAFSINITRVVGGIVVGSH